MQDIYLDHNATTPLLPEVLEAMRPYLTEMHGNPASAHQAGRRVRRALEDARELLAALLDAYPDEMVFTSGATEANNLALFGLAGTPPGQLLVSPLEHPCVMEPVRQLVETGFGVDWLAVDPAGVVEIEDLEDRISPDTRLAAVMLANHETGALQPVANLVRLLPASLAFHCDAAAAAGKVPVRFHQLGVTSLALSAHKFHGPPGIGALLVRRGTKLRPLLFGGHQQQGRRPGTESAALAVGMAAALELADHDMAQRRQKVEHLRRMFLNRLQATAAPVILNGPERERLPHTLNLSFPGCRAESLLMNLDLAGIACSTGSACSSGSLLPSPVLQAMHVPKDLLDSAMRFSLSDLLSEEELQEAARRIAEVVGRLRQE